MSHATRPSVQRQARLSLLGPVRLTDAAGRDRTPRSPHQQCILAVVALGGTGGVSRARLQDLFWGDKDKHRAAQSLRTALHGLRRSLVDFGAPLIEIDANRVRILPGALQVDLFEIARDGRSDVCAYTHGILPDVMEGADIDAEPFEDWLREERSHWHARLDALSEHEPPLRANAVQAVPPTVPDPRPIVGLLEPVIHSKSFQALYLGEALIDRLAFGLRDYVGARTFDYRDLAEDQAQAAQTSPDLYLRLRLYEMGSELSVRILVLRQSTHELLWSVLGGPYPVDRISIETGALQALIGETLDRIAGSLARIPARSANAPLSPFHVLTSMFQLDHSALSSLRNALNASWDLTGEVIYPAMLAYLNSFRVGEHWTSFDGSLEEDTRRLLSHVEDSAVGDGITYGLAGHARGYILHDHDDANALLDRAIRMVPYSAFCWDHMALHHVYNARYSDARMASQTALTVGAYSPIRFTMETTRCMIATLEGDFANAVELGRRVLSRRPNYGAALRYSAVSMAHLGDTQAARDCVSHIRAMDPDFSVAWVGEDRMAVRTDAAKTILTDGLLLAGAK